MYKLASLLLLLVKVSAKPVYTNDYYPTQAPALDHANNPAAPVYIVPYEEYYGGQEYVPLGGYSPPPPYYRQPVVYYTNSPAYSLFGTPPYYPPASPATADATIQSNEASLKASSIPSKQPDPPKSENTPTETTVTTETPAPEPPKPEEEEEVKAAKVSDDSFKDYAFLASASVTAEPAPIDDSSSSSPSETDNSSKTVEPSSNEDKTDNTVEPSDSPSLNDISTHSRKTSLDNPRIKEFDPVESQQTATVDQTLNSASADSIESPAPKPRSKWGRRRKHHSPRRQYSGEE